jgi:hypothetical protein
MNKNREQLLAYLAIGAVALLLGDKLFLTPLAQKWKDQSEEIARLKTQIEDGQQKILREKALTLRWRRMQKESLPQSTTAERRGSLSPVEAEKERESQSEGEVLSAIYRWADESGISFTNFKPQWKRDRDEDYSFLDCRASAFGSISEVSRFVYELEKDPIPVRIDELELTARTETGTELSIALRFSGLQLKSNR